MKFMKTQKDGCVDVLAGKCFHSFKDGKVSWQGIVNGRAYGDLYLVTLFEWVGGEPHMQQLISIETMRSWFFYDDTESMRISYEYGAASGLRGDRAVQEVANGKVLPAKCEEKKA